MKIKFVQALLLSIAIAPLSASTHISNGDKDIEFKSTIIEKNLTTKQEKPKRKSKVKLKNKIYSIGWTSTNVNIREEPNIKSKILGVADFNTKLKYTKSTNNWLQIEYKNQRAYIHSDYVKNIKCKYKDYSVPSNSGFKSYMPYKAITNKSSNQYELQTEYAYTGNYGIRQINGRYCVAIGTAFNAQVGDYADLILSNGEVIKIIVSDIKDNKDTEHNNVVTASNGCVSEFIVDMSALNSTIRKFGDVSYSRDNWDNRVAVIRVYEKNILN